MLKAKDSEQKNKKRTIWLISSISVVIILLVAFWCNKSFLDLYYFNLRHNHFKINDKLYANDFIVNESNNLMLFRKVKPISGNSKGKPFMASSAWSISSDSLCKYKTACIGTYTGYEIQSIEGNEYYPMLFFSITTNKKALIKKGFTGAPAGYEFEDGPLYVWGHLMTDKELNTFRKIKM
jgi:hypothetical protein